MGFVALKRRSGGEAKEDWGACCPLSLVVVVFFCRCFTMQLGNAGARREVGFLEWKRKRGDCGALGAL